MTLEERIDYSKRRVDSAYENLEVAKLLVEKEFYNAAISRLYYATFYVVNALLVLNGFSVKTHSTTRSVFSQHFIKTRKFDIGYGKLFAELFYKRQKGDYDAIYNFSKEEVDLLFPASEQMIDEIATSVLNQIQNS